MDEKNCLIVSGQLWDQNKQRKHLKNTYYIILGQPAPPSNKQHEGLGVGPKIPSFRGRKLGTKVPFLFVGEVVGGYESGACYTRPKLFWCFELCVRFCFFARRSGGAQCRTNESSKFFKAHQNTPQDEGARERTLAARK